MSETVHCVEGIRIKGLPDGMKYQLMSNLDEAIGTGKGWVVVGTHPGIHAPKETATKGYVRVRKLNAKTPNEKNGTLYIVTLQGGHVWPPPCPSAMGGGRRKSKTYKKKRMSKKRMTRRR
jgi:hypothetical protein